VLRPRLPRKPLRAFQQVRNRHIHRADALLDDNYAVAPVVVEDRPFGGAEFFRFGHGKGQAKNVRQ